MDTSAAPLPCGGAADAATYRDWIIHAGLDIEPEHLVPEVDSGYELFWTRRKPVDPHPL